MRGIPKSRATGSAATAGAAIAIPAGVGIVKVKCSGDAFLGIGPDNSPPAAATGNSTYLDSGMTEYLTLGNAGRSQFTHLYIYGASATVTYYVSWFGA